MKAVVIREHGGPDVLRYEDCADPVAKAGEVPVRVAAAAVAAGELTIPIDRGLPLSAAGEGHAAVEKGGVGKVLLLV